MGSRRLPAAEHVTRTLQERIAQGYYSAGGWLPAERDLAEELDVSRPVVRAGLARLAEQGLIVREHGRRPRVSAGTAYPVRLSGLMSIVGASTVAAVIPQHPTYVWAHAILRGINYVLNEGDGPHRLTVFDTYPSASAEADEFAEAELERAALERIRQEGAAGIIAWLSGRSTGIPLEIEDVGVPVVYIDRHPASRDCDYVGVDNRAGVYRAVEYLLNLGHRRIGYLTIAGRITPIIEREEGYRAALLARGIMPAQELVHSMTLDQGLDMRAAFEHFASLSPAPTAVVAVSDEKAFAFMKECRARGWRVPEDISIVGFDDIEHYSPHPAMLTTVHQPFEQMGRRAAELLLRRLAAEPPALGRSYQQIVLPASLVVRATCRAPKAERA